MEPGWLAAGSTLPRRERGLPGDDRPGARQDC